MAKEGKSHLKYLQDVLLTKDYLTQLESNPALLGAQEDWSVKQIEEAIDKQQFLMQMADLTRHKEGCPGCTKDMLVDIKQKVHALARR